MSAQLQADAPNPTRFGAVLPTGSVTLSAAEFHVFVDCLAEPKSLEDLIASAYRAAGLRTLDVLDAIDELECKGMLEVQPGHATASGGA